MTAVPWRRLMLDERRDLKRFLEQLTPEQWQHRTLSGEWNVRDLVAHLVGWDDLLLYRSRREHLRALFAFFALYVRSFGSMAGVNRRIDAQTSGLTRDELLGRFALDEDPELKWLFDGSNPGAHLAEYVIHHQDMRRPLGLPRQVPPDRLAAALDGVTKLPSVRISARRRLRSRRWEATDVDWHRGRGPVVRAPGESILMTLAGRPAGVADS